jgi:microcystin-dependent protein
MGTPYLGELRWISFNFPPKGWALCNGQLMSIQQNSALFSLLGTTFGGNGTTTFALPNMQGRVPIQAAGSSYALGQAGGEEAHTLITAEMAAHNHAGLCVNATGNSAVPANSLWAKSAKNDTAYSGTASTQMIAGSITPTGGGQAHENRQPFLVLNLIIALQGAFPSQN